MPTNSLDNYFEPVGGSQLNFGSGFATTLKNILDNVDENFQRIVGAPFMRGDNGKSVVRGYEEIYNELSQEFTNFGLKLVSAIWPDLDTTNIVTYSDLVNALVTLNDTIGGTNSCDFLNPDTSENPNFVNKIDYYTLESDGDYKVFVGLYFFTDARLEQLRNSDDPNLHDFVDHSCVLYGITEQQSDNTWAWNIKRYAVLPLVYFDQTMGCFCWQLNGVQTGISCEGTIGPNGDPARIWLCTGVRYTYTDVPQSEQDKIVIKEVIANNSGLPNNVNNIQENDLVYIWFDEYDQDISPDTIWDYDYEHDNEYPYYDFMMGVVALEAPGTTNKYVQYNGNYTLSFLSQKGYHLRAELNAIGYYSSTPTPPASNLRGLIIPFGGHIGSDSSTDATMIYTVGDNYLESEVHIADVPYSNTRGTQLQNNSVSEYNSNSKLKFDYDDVESIPVANGSGVPINWLKRDYKSNVDGKAIGVSELSYNNATLTVNAKTAFPSSTNIETEFEVRRPNDVFYIGDINPTNSSHPIIPGDGSSISSAIENFGKAGLQFLSTAIPVDSISSLDLTGNTVGSYSYKNIFNFLPNPTDKPGSANFNMRYMRHDELSTGKWNLAMCFNPVMYTTKEEQSFILNMKLPSIKLIKDWSGNYNDNDMASRRCFGNGTHAFKSGLQQDHEIVVSKETKFINPFETLSFETNLSFVPVNDAQSSIDSDYQTLASFMGSHTMREPAVPFSNCFKIEKDTLKFEINNLIDELVINPISTKSIVLFSGSPLTVKLENPIQLEQLTSISPIYYLAEYLRFYGLAVKRVKTVDSTVTVQFVFLWQSSDEYPSIISSQIVDGLTMKGQTNYAETLNQVSIIKRTGDYTVDNNLWFYDSGATDDINAKINNLLAVSCIVTFDTTTYEVISVEPLNSDFSNGATVDVHWKFKKVGSSTNGLALYNWQYLAFLGDGSLSNKLYITPPESWNININTFITKKSVNASNYDFYTIDIGKSSISTLKKYEDFDTQKISDTFEYASGGNICSPTYYRYMGSLVQGINSSGYYNKKLTNMTESLSVQKQYPGQAAPVSLSDIGSEQSTVNLDFSDISLRSLQNSQDIRTTQQIAQDAQSTANRTISNDLQLLDVTPIS